MWLLVRFINTFQLKKNLIYNCFKGFRGSCECTSDGSPCFTYCIEVKSRYYTGSKTKECFHVIIWKKKQGKRELRKFETDVTWGRWKKRREARADMLCNNHGSGGSAARHKQPSGHQRKGNGVTQHRGGDFGHRTHRSLMRFLAIYKPMKKGTVCRQA